MRALVTGGRGGIGAAIVAALGNAETTVLDLPEFDVGEPGAWRSLEGEFDAAFLNAGTSTGVADPAGLSDESWHLILRANLEGVVYGTRELAARLMPPGGSIVATASLAGLTGMPGDPAYTATKHAVVGWVRAAAPSLAERGIRLNALCPGFTDTPIVDPELRGQLDVPLNGARVRRGRGAARARGRGDGPRLGRAAEPRRAFPLPRSPRTAMSPRSRKPWGEHPPPDPHVWNTLAYRGLAQADGHAVIEWDAPPEYCFHSPSGPIVHGGMVAALLDTAMGGACWTLMAEDEDFLTADLRTEFHRSARPGILRAEGRVVQRNRRVVFCAAELFQDDQLIASARCTQIVRRDQSG